MPQREEHQTRDLWIRLEDRRSQGFAPGDTIQGTIKHATRAVAPRARLNLTLYGRSKCKMTVGHGPDTYNAGTSYRSRFHLFDPDATSRVVLDEPLHIENGGEHAVWPFSISIPPVADWRTLWDSDDRRASYMPLCGPDQPLPDSFTLSYENGNKKLAA